MKGIEVLLDSYADLADSHGVVLCHQDVCRDVASWIAATLRLRGNPFSGFGFSTRNDETFYAALKSATQQVRAVEGVSRIVIVVFEYDTMSFMTPLLRTVEELAPTEVDVVRVIGCVPEFLELAMQVSRHQLRTINAGVLARLMESSSVRVTSKSGTDLDVSLDSAYSWMSNYGRPSERRFITLPPGEVNTFPRGISGQFVADGAINVNVTVDFDVRLANHPITFIIEDGVVVDFRVSHASLHSFLRQAFSRPFVDHVGEFGIGTNVGITRFIRLNSHINERHPGMHLGFGEHGQPGRVPWQAEIHLDAIAANIAICTDEGFVIDTSELGPSHEPHPEGIRGEDVDGAGEGT